MQAHIDLTQPAGTKLEAAADATWCERNLYALILTYACGAVFHAYLLWHRRTHNSRRRVKGAA